MVWGPGINLKEDSSPIPNSGAEPRKNSEEKHDVKRQESAKGLGSMDLFSMLNQNISQSTQNNQVAQNTSQFQLSMSEQEAHNHVAKDKKVIDNGADDEFEELSESREIIEDRIFRLKL